MKKIFHLDENGLFIGDDWINDNDELPEGCVDPDLFPIQEGLYTPKFDGVQWIEGKSQEEIDAIKSAPQSPTLQDQIDSIQQAILTLMDMSMI